MDQAAHNKIVSFIWGIADDVLRDLFVRGKYRDVIRDDVAPQVAADRSYQNAKENTPNTARLEHDKALHRVMLTLLKDDTEVYKQFVQNESFRRFVTDMVFSLTTEEPPARENRTPAPAL